MGGRIVERRSAGLRQQEPPAISRSGRCFASVPVVEGSRYRQSQHAEWGWNPATVPGVDGSRVPSTRSTHKRAHRAIERVARRRGQAGGSRRMRSYWPRSRAMCADASAADFGNGYEAPCWRQSAASSFCCCPVGPRCRSRGNPRSSPRSTRRRRICASACAAVFGAKQPMPRSRQSAASVFCCSPVGPRARSERGFCAVGFGFIAPRPLRSGALSPRRSPWALLPRAL
jgi:hypothetical protein